MGGKIVWCDRNFASTEGLKKKLMNHYIKVTLFQLIAKATFLIFVQ